MTAASADDHRMRLSDSESDSLQLLSARWTMHILLVLHAHQSPCRFRDLLEAVPGLSNRMLSSRLAALENDGLVAREVAATRPVSITYRLTRRGREISDILDQLRQKIAT